MLKKCFHFLVEAICSNFTQVELPITPQDIIVAHLISRKDMKLTHWALGHLLPTHSLALHCLLCSQTLLHSLAHSLVPTLMGKRFMSINWMRRFYKVSTHCVLERKWNCELTKYLTSGLELSVSWSLCVPSKSCWSKRWRTRKPNQCFPSSIKLLLSLPPPSLSPFSDQQMLFSRAYRRVSVVSRWYYES